MALQPLEHAGSEFRLGRDGTQALEQALYFRPNGLTVERRQRRVRRAGPELKAFDLAGGGDHVTVVGLGKVMIIPRHPEHGYHWFPKASLHVRGHAGGAQRLVDGVYRTGEQPW